MTRPPTAADYLADARDQIQARGPLPLIALTESWRSRWPDHATGEHVTRMTTRDGHAVTFAVDLSRRACDAANVIAQTILEDGSDTHGKALGATEAVLIHASESLPLLNAPYFSQHADQDTWCSLLVATVPGPARPGT